MKRSKNHSVLSGFVTPWTVACQASLSMEFSREEYWSGLEYLLQGIFPTQGSNPGVPHCRQMFTILNQEAHIQRRRKKRKK